MTARALLEAAATLRRDGEDFVIATVVDVRGSAYRRPGARMLVTRDRWIAGSVSGGCLEGDVVHKGFWRTDGGGPVVVTYDSTLDSEGDELRAGLALGCNGVVDVLLERAGHSAIDPLAVLERCARGQRRAAVATVFRSDVANVAIGSRIALDADGAVDGTLTDPILHGAVVAHARAALRAGNSTVTSFAGYGVCVLIEVVVPPPRLFVLGAGHDAVPVVSMARALGWQVFVCIPHARPAVRERFAHADGFVFGTPDEIVHAIDAADRAVAVVMNHHYELDRAALDALVASRVRYVGMLGPRHRTARMLVEVGCPIDSRLHAPIGLELGAETPEEIALAIVAEIQAVLATAQASRLRDRAGPIHHPPMRVAQREL